MTTTNDNPARTSPRADVLLWATAAVLAALILFQGRGLIDRPQPDPTLAEMVSQSGSYALMTTSGGGDEILAVIDNRNEILLVYRVDQLRAVNLQAREDLGQIFRAAHARARGAP